MKKSIFLITVILLLTGTRINAQKVITEGKIVFEISFPDTSNSMMAGMLGKKQVLYFKDSSSRVETNNMMGDMVVLANGSSGDSYVLMEKAGEKYAIKMTDMDKGMLLGDDKPENVKIKKEKGSKKIAGYNCTKSTVTFKVKGYEATMEVWTTEEVKGPSPQGAMKFDQLKGYPMEFTTATAGISMKMTCTSVEQMSVPLNMFTVPDDYTIKTMAEIMMGGMK